jgi:hypothetical protein
MQAHTASEPLSAVLMRDSDFMEKYEWLHGYVVEDFTFEKFACFLGELVHVQSHSASPMAQRSMMYALTVAR